LVFMTTFPPSRRFRCVVLYRGPIELTVSKKRQSAAGIRTQLARS